MYSVPFLDLPPLASVGGTVRLPGSKSISNRVLLLAGFCSGRTRIDGLLESDDTRVMLDALQALGCRAERTADTLWLTGLGGRPTVRDAELFLGNSGTSMRSLAAALAVLGTTHGGHYRVHGVARMHERPIGDLVDALRPLGCRIGYTGREGYPPLRLGDGSQHALQLDRPIRVRGDVSSQFLTGLLQALCLAPAEREVVIEVVGELISRPYIGITLTLLERFGIRVRNDGWSRFTIPAGALLASPGAVQVEGDASSASYFVALGAIAAAPAAPLRIEGMGRDSIQGDLAFVAAAEAMGARAVMAANHVEVSRGTWPLRAVSLDCNALPDAAMTLAAMALYATELRKLGATVRDGDDWIEIEPPTIWRAASIDTYDDHRIAMCLSLAAFNGVDGKGAGVPVRIVDPRCVAKTYPDYFETLLALAMPRPGRVPVITIDGPTASGKGTLASAVAARLGYHFLDSGAVYRATALVALRTGLDTADEAGLTALAERLDLHFEATRIRIDGVDVTDALRLEEVGALASRVSAFPRVREALRGRQLAFHRAPGLVADGRDMGTVVFPTADLKVFLTASAATRAERRFLQLIERGIAANIDGLRAELEARDARDRTRRVAPLEPAVDAVLLDNSALSIDDSVAWVLEAWERRRPF